MKNIMQNEFFNGSGWISTFLAVWFNIGNWMTEINFNQVLTVVISVLSVVFLVMKMYDQFLITRQRRKDVKSNSTIK